jgi:hypothetical protein
LLAWSVRVPAITTGNDDAVYLLLARSLRTGRYIDLFYVGLPIHSQYPPLYPGLLALLGSVFGEHIGIFLAANVLLSMAALGLLFDVARRRESTVALLALAVAATNPTLLAMAGGVRSEPLCMALTALTLWLVARSPSTPSVLVAAGAAAIAAALTRSAAITVVGALLLAWALERRWRAVAFLVVAAGLTVGAWFTWTIQVPSQLSGHSYIGDVTKVVRLTPRPGDTGQLVQLAQPESVMAPPAPAHAPGLLPTLVGRVQRNFLRYALTVMSALELPHVAGTRVDNLLWLLAITTFGAVGLWGMRRWWLAGALVLVCTGGLLAVWPFVLSRYLVPILPLGIIALVSGAGDADMLARTRVRWRGRGNLLPAILALGILVGAVPQTTTLLRTARDCRSRGEYAGGRCNDADERAFFEATGFIASSTPDSARFLAAKEGAFYYYAHRQVVPIYGVTEGRIGDIPAYLAANRAEYIFLSHLKIDEWAAARPLLAICGDLTVVRNWGPTTLLLRLNPGGTSSSTTACDAIRIYGAAPWGTRE